jgi:DNA-binding NtrC family response regulator
MSPTNILFDINNIDFDFSAFAAGTWHTNCLKKSTRNFAMAEGEKRVLIIDPDPKERRDLAQHLKNENYYIETGKNLSEAIKKISEGCFDCLVIDIDLPEMRGYEAVPILKNLDSKLKVIMTTKKNTKRLEAKVREQDIFFYFIKSFGKDELKLAIRNAFNP